jgi:hypothetical protein
METGTTPVSNAIDFSGISLPFSVNDLLGSSMGLLGIVGSFVLLGLAIVYVPKLIGVIRASANSKGTK